MKRIRLFFLWVTLILTVSHPLEAHADEDRYRSEQWQHRGIQAMYEMIFEPQVIDSLYLISQAREAIHLKNAMCALEHLRKAEDILYQIGRILPTRTTRRLIMTAKASALLDKPSETLSLFPPIYASLALQRDFTPVQPCRDHLNRAKEAVIAGDRDKARSELTMAGDSVTEKTADQALILMHERMDNAMKYLRMKQYVNADNQLREITPIALLLAKIMHDHPLKRVCRGLKYACQALEDREFVISHQYLEETKNQMKRCIMLSDGEKEKVLKSLAEKLKQISPPGWEHEPKPEMLQKLKEIEEKAVDLYNQEIENMK